MREVLGWLALTVSLSGLALVARGDRRGWGLRLASGALWLLFAILNRAPVYVVTSVLYMMIDLYGWRRRQTKTSEARKALIRIHGEPRGRLNLWTEN